VGADADIASLVAESLGLKLDLRPIAWADWPLGLTSGKYDAMISNIGVTEAQGEVRLLHLPARPSRLLRP
jgi:polar amino acid transport system substrate-binding protein